MANKKTSIDEIFTNGIQLSREKRSSSKVGNSENSDNKTQQTRKSVGNTILKLYEITESGIAKIAADAGQDLNRYLNATERGADSIKELGDVNQITSSLKVLTKDILDILSQLPDPTQHQFLFMPLQLEAILELKNSLAAAQNAGSLPDLMTAVLSLRPSVFRLFSTINLLESDPGLLNDLDFIHSKMWDGDLNHGIHQRNNLGDNALLPDMTIVKPIFMLFIDDKIKNELGKLGVDPVLIAALDNWSIPSYRFDGELGSISSLGSIAPDTPIAPHKFEWSRNGTNRHNLKTLTEYQRNTNQFLNDIKAKYKLAQAKSLSDYTYTMAFTEVMAAWLNGAFKAIVEANGNIDSAVLKGIQFEKDRLYGLSNAALSYQFLAEAKGSDGVSSIFKTLTDSLNSGLRSVITRKLYYSDYAYKFISKEFKTLTFSIDSKDDKYFVGSTLIGNHKIKVNILPKLYVPVDLSKKQRVDLKYLGRSYRVVDAYRYQYQYNRSFYIKDRDLAYNSRFVVYSIMHELIQMPASVFNGLVHSFQERFSSTTYNGHLITMRQMLETAFPERRELSAIPPHYLKAIILEQTPTVFHSTSPEGEAPVDPEEEIDTAKNRWNWAHIDMAFQKDIHANNKNGWGLLDSSKNVPYLMGDVIKAIYNFHADFSWIEMGMAFAMMVTNGTFTASAPRAPHSSVSKPLDFGDALNLPDDDETGDLRLTGVVSSEYATNAKTLSWAHVMRNHYFTLLYTLKENVSAVAWFEDFDFSDKSGIKPSLIKRSDIDDSFRYEFHGNMLVDNKMRSELIYYPIVTAGSAGSGFTANFSGVKRRLEQGNLPKITEGNILSNFMTESFLDKGLLLFNNNQEAEPILFNPQFIPGTDIIAYAGDFTGVDVNNMNPHVYLKHNVMPIWKSFSVTLPTNAPRTGTGANELFSVNINPARFVAHALLAAGVIKSNIQPVLQLIGAAFGIPVESSQLMLRPGTGGTFYNLTPGNNFAVDYMTEARYMENAVGVITSQRYNSNLHFSVFQNDNARVNTGYTDLLPVAQAAFVSYLKSKRYRGYFGLENFNRRGHNTLDLAKSVSELLTLDVNVSNTLTDYDILISIKPNDVYKVLDLVDPEFSHL